MKKLVSILAVTALATSAFAQGTIVFATGTGLVKKWTSGSDSTLVNVAAGQGKVELFAAPTGTALNAFGTVGAGGTSLNYSTIGAFLAANPGWTDYSAKITTINPTPGNFSGGTITLTGVAGGASADYFLLGWTGTFATFADALAGGAFIGVSGKFTTATGDPAATPSPIPAVNTKLTFEGLTLAPVPEPTTFALAGLGLAALLVFRRRN